MSTDYEAQVYLGWLLDTDDFEKLCEEREAVTHDEKLFDHKTGDEIEPETVCDEEEGRYWHGELVMGDWNVCEVLQEWLDEQKIGLKIAPLSDQYGFESFVIGHDIDGRIRSGISNITAKQAEFVLEHFKINTLPQVHAFLDVCQ